MSHTQPEKQQAAEVKMTQCETFISSTYISQEKKHQNLHHLFKKRNLNRHFLHLKADTLMDTV